MRRLRSEPVPLLRQLRAFMFAVNVALAALAAPAFAQQAAQPQELNLYTTVSRV
jgi:hypothetical protein